MKAERKKTLNEHKADLAQEDELLDKTLEIIKKNEGRITQKKIKERASLPFGSKGKFDSN